MSGLFCRCYSIFYYVASDLGLHCLPLTFYGLTDKNGLNTNIPFFVLQNESLLSGNAFIIK